MSVAKELEEIASEICDNYCRWPEEYGVMYELYKAEERLAEKCENCPLMRLFKERER